LAYFLYSAGCSSFLTNRFSEIPHPTITPHIVATHHLITPQIVLSALQPPVMMVLKANDRPSGDRFGISQRINATHHRFAFRA
jgi:hypothetical protein